MITDVARFMPFNSPRLRVGHKAHVVISGQSFSGRKRPFAAVGSAAQAAETMEDIHGLRAFSAVGVDFLQPIQFGGELLDALIALFQIHARLV